VLDFELRYYLLRAKPVRFASGANDLFFVFWKQLMSFSYYDGRYENMLLKMILIV